MTNPPHQPDPNQAYQPPPIIPGRQPQAGPPAAPQQQPQNQQPPPPQYYVPQPMYPPQQPPPRPGYVYAQTKTTLPTWMILIYAIGGLPTCGLLWIAGLIHWWVVQSRSKTNTTIHPPL